MQLNPEQEKWLEDLTEAAGAQVTQEKHDSRKQALLEKYAEEREKQMGEILDGMKILFGREGEDGDMETMDVYRDDNDQMKQIDLDEQKQGYRVLSKDGKRVEGGFDEEGRPLEQPEFEKFLHARGLLEKMTEEMTREKIKGKDKHGRPVEKPLFDDDELTREVYDPLVRRGVPETFIGNKHSRTQKLAKGVMKSYGKRLEKDALKGVVAENKDLGIALFRMCVSIPGNVITSDGATKLSASQQETHGKIDPIHVFQQNFGVTKNDGGDFADNIQKAAQSWAFIQNVSDLGFDGVLESKNTVGELKELKEKKGEEGEEGEEGGEEEHKFDRAKAAPVMTQAIVAAVAMNVGKGMSAMGTAASTIFSSLLKRTTLRDLLAKKDLKESDLDGMVVVLVDAVRETLAQVIPVEKNKKALEPQVKAAVKSVDSGLRKLDKKKLLAALEEGKCEQAVKIFNVAAGNVSSALSSNLGTVLRDYGTLIEEKASEYISDDLNEAMKEAVKPEEDDDHEEKYKHKPDWMEVKGAQVCLRCKPEFTEVELFSGILDQKIEQLKKDDAAFKMAVNLGGLAFDVAANFLAPLAMGGALLRMAKHTFAAVKRFIDFKNFTDSKKAMMNAASIYSPSVKRFCADSAKQGTFYSINAACEGVKVIGACLQCSPAVIGGIIAAQAASGVEAVAAVLYELDKRLRLELAWIAYKKALNNPENRKLALKATRENPTMAKYAIAWGAVVEEDPLVGDFLEYANLNADTVKGNANVDKVVEYLEARMPDDVVVTGRRYAKQGQKAKVELTAESWIEQKASGETQWNVTPMSTGSIESALTAYEVARMKLDDVIRDKKSRATRQAKAQAALKAVTKVSGALLSYAPKDKKHGGSVSEMEDVVQQFLGEVNKRIKEHEDYIAKIKPVKTTGQKVQTATVN